MNTLMAGLENPELTEPVDKQGSLMFGASVKPIKSQTELDLLPDTGPLRVDPLSRRMSQLVLLLGPCVVLVHQSPPVQYMTHSTAIVQCPPSPSPTSYREILYIS